MTRRSLRLLSLVLLLAVAGTGLHAVTSGSASADERTVVAFRDYPYDDDVRNPTADEPQSKLWYAHGSWWALMATRADGSVKIRRLSDVHRWRSTGTVVDRRVNSTADVLWDGSRLYVASRAADSDMRVSRFAFDESRGSWSRIGAPESVATGGSTSASIAKDSLGRLWVTYVEGSRIMVAHTTNGDHSWGAPFQPILDGVTPAEGELSAVVSFDGNIGVMWADERADQFRFAVHADDADDSVWAGEVAAGGYHEADDHVHLLTAPAANGTRVLAVVKTGVDEVSGVADSATQIAVLDRSVTGSWRSIPAGTIADGHNRPIGVVDATNDQLYVIAAAHDQGVFYKRSPLADLRFPEGTGKPLVSFGAATVDYPTASKAPVTAESGLVVLANGGGAQVYFHAEMSLPERLATDPTPPTRPANLFTEVTGGCGVNLMWPPASDNAELLRYDLTRDGVDLAATTETSYTDLSASCGATHLYEVSAVDAAGNRSSPRAADPVTTPDAVNPGSGIWLAGNSTADSGGAGRLDLPLPPSKRGDLLIASIDAIGVPAVKGPPGWRLVRRDAQANSLVKLTYTRVATGDEPPVIRWQLSAGTSAVGNALAYRGVDTDDPVAVVAGQGNTASTNIETPSVVLASAGTMVVGLFGVGGLVSVAPPDQMVALFEQNSSAGPRRRISGAAAQMSNPVVASGLIATASGAWPSIGQLLVLRPETAAGP